MIVSFKDKETEKVFNGQFSRRIPIDIQKKGVLKLRMIHRAKSIDDLRVPPGNCFKYLQGNFVGYCSIRINKQYRVCFQVDEEMNIYEVEIVDYH